MSDALTSFLMTNPAVYQAANPTTTPQDYQLLLDAIRRMPERPQGQVRIRENDPGINGTVNTNDQLAIETGRVVLKGPPEIFISRQGPNYKSKDPWRIAGTLHHENRHLQGETEAEARESQRQFIADAMASGQMKKNKGYLKDVTEAAATFKGIDKSNGKRLTRDVDMERDLLLQALRKE
jgi:hypothetical protein